MTEERSVALGPRAHASNGGVAVGRDAKADGPDAMAIGDGAVAGPGQRVIADTIFGVPIEEAFYEGQLADAVVGPKIVHRAEPKCKRYVTYMGDPTQTCQHCGGPEAAHR